jgi:quinol monooxygenase YgiN
MDDQVSWLLEGTVKPGELDNLKALINEMVESTRAEPGALNYQWCISDDNTTVHNFDRYRDSAAARTHLEGFLSNYAGRYMEAVDTTRFSVYGAPSDEVKKIVNGFGGAYYGLIEGFTR